MDCGLLTFESIVSRKIMFQNLSFTIFVVLGCHFICVYLRFTGDVVPVARLEDFRALKSSNLEDFRALKPYGQIGGF